MAARDEIVAWADELLDARAFRDYGPNGLQVPGADEVTAIATAVSCTLDVFERAAAAGAQLLLVHHGLFWRGDALGIDRRLRDRLKVLFAHDINLVQYHLPLDAHQEIGNNALLLQALGLRRTDEPFAVHDGLPVGMVGTYDDPIGADELAERVRSTTARDPLVLGTAPDRIRRVAICSGGAARYLDEAARLGADAFVTGEPAEFSDANATEAGMAFLAAGHHATETFGVRALGERIATRFDVTHTFLDADNPV